MSLLYVPSASSILFAFLYAAVCSSWCITYRSHLTTGLCYAGHCIYMGRQCLCSKSTPQSALPRQRRGWQEPFFATLFQQACLPPARPPLPLPRGARPPGILLWKQAWRQQHCYLKKVNMGPCSCLSEGLPSLRGKRGRREICNVKSPSAVYKVLAACTKANRVHHTISDGHLHIWRWQRWIRNLVLFSLPLLPPTSHPTLENSHLLSRNHPIYEWVIGVSAVILGRRQRKLSNSPLDERNTACFLIYKYMYVCMYVYVNSLEKHSRELPHSPLSPAVFLLQVVTVVPLSSTKSGPLAPAFCRPFLPGVPLQVVFFGHGV